MGVLGWASSKVNHLFGRLPLRAWVEGFRSWKGWRAYKAFKVLCGYYTRVPLRTWRYRLWSRVSAGFYKVVAAPTRVR